MEFLYFQEFERFSKEKIDSVFDSKSLQNLFEKNILKSETRYSETSYYFNYVGVICSREKICVMLPKYLNREKINDKKFGEEKAKEIVEVIKKYMSNKLYETFLNSLGEQENIGEYNRFALYDFLISDYIEHGLYENQKDTYELNGEGELDWEKTINEMESYLMKNSNIIYLDYITNEIEQDNNGYIRKLHKYYLNISSLYFEKIDFLGLDYPIINFHIEEEDLGGIEFQLHKVQQELQGIFSERKIRLLKVLLILIESQNHLVEEGVSFYGTTTFYNIWEEACSQVLENQYEEYKKYISKIEWTMSNGKVRKPEITLIPDILVTREDKFFIFDAKYYAPDLKKIENLPGVGDITKQYLYELAFKNVEKFKGKERKNILLIPSDKNEILYEGNVKMEFLSRLNLQDIMLFSLPAQKVFKYYCQNKTFGNQEFGTFEFLPTD